MVQAKRGIEVPIYWTTCGNTESIMSFLLCLVFCLVLHSLLLLPLDSYIVFNSFIFKNTSHLRK